MDKRLTHISCYPVISAASLPASRGFYEQVVGFRAVWENDWFLLLQSPDRPEVQLGFVQPDHDSLPEAYRDMRPAGVVVTIEVDDASAAYRHATASGVEMIQSLRDEAFGQRHFMMTDPDGLLVDVVQQIFVSDPTTE